MFASGSCFFQQLGLIMLTRMLTTLTLTDLAINTQVDSQNLYKNSITHEASKLYVYF